MGAACGGSEDKPVDVPDAGEIVSDASVTDDAGTETDPGIPGNDAGISGEDAGSHGGTIEFTEGTFTDQRDNNTYKTISMEILGAAFTLTAENMRYAGSDASGAPLTYHSANGNSANDAVFGLLYDRDTAVNDVCPPGWRVPTSNEVYYFIKYVNDTVGGGAEMLFNALAAQSSAWTCASNAINNASGFGALPAGQWDLAYESGSQYMYFGERAHFWTSTYEEGKYNTFSIDNLKFNDSCAEPSRAFFLAYARCETALSVRCLREDN